jgi:hypothetical protein
MGVDMDYVRFGTTVNVTLNGCVRMCPSGLQVKVCIEIYEFCVERGSFAVDRQQTQAGAGDCPPFLSNLRT